MAIVVRGLGQPEDGALVAGGLGSSEPAVAGSMAATLTGLGTVNATLSALSGVQASANGGAVLIRKPVQPRQHQLLYRDASAHLHGSSTLSATISFAINFDAELEHLLLVGAL